MKQSLSFVALLTLALLFAGGCTTKQKPSSTLAEKLDSLSAAYLTMDGPGGAVLVAAGDSVIFSKGYGVSDTGTKENITTKTLFNLGSISKTFVSNTILMLDLEQKLSVEDNLLKYFPEFKNKGIARKVKIRHLLTHTSGLPDNRNVNADSVFYLTANDAQNWHPVTQADSLDFEPGAQYEYSNPAFNGLALIIEKVTGKKWQDVVAERIFGPSGMKTSTITDGAHPQSGVAHGYIRANNVWKEDDYGEEPTFCAAGNGGVWSSVEELYNYERAIRYSQFSTPEVLEDSRTIKTFPNWTSAIPPFIGWSWFIDEKSYGVKTVGHTGTQGGFYCNYVTVPDQEVLVVILANFPFERERMTDAMMTLLKNADWAERARSPIAE
jgi:CubicO group peptidase (beta-lactamase class C family)